MFNKHNTLSHFIIFTIHCGQLFQLIYLVFTFWHLCFHNDRVFVLVTPKKKTFYFKFHRGRRHCPEDNGTGERRERRGRQGVVLASLRLDCSSSQLQTCRQQQRQVRTRFVVNICKTFKYSVASGHLHIVGLPGVALCVFWCHYGGAIVVGNVVAEICDVNLSVDVTVIAVLLLLLLLFMVNI